jgi:hypothetical protein
VGGALPVLFDFQGERCDRVVANVLRRLRAVTIAPAAPVS